MGFAHGPASVGDYGLVSGLAGPCLEVGGEGQGSHDDGGSQAGGGEPAVAA